jgi:hypothetical protein
MTRDRWSMMDALDRVLYCVKHEDKLFGLRTYLDWDILSPTSQLLLTFAED